MSNQSVGHFGKLDSSMGDPGVKIMFLTHLGPTWMSETDSERHFAPDCMSRISKSWFETSKMKDLMIFWTKDLPAQWI